MIGDIEGFPATYSTEVTSAPPADGLYKARGPRRFTSEEPDDIAADEVFPELEPGHVRIGPDILSDDAVQDLCDLAQQIKLESHLSPKHIRTIMEEIQKSRSISKENLKDLDRFVRDMRGWHKDLHAQYRESGYSDKAVNQDLLRCHQFLYQWDGAKERYRIQARTNELNRIAPGSSAISPTTSAFYAFASISQRDMRDTLGVMENLKEAHPTIASRGNKTTMLTRDEIWQTKMRLLDEAIADGQAGKPTEIDVQYYELTSQTMLSKLVAAARVGNKLRVNVDPGRLNEDRDGYYYASEMARKMQTAYRLLDSADEGLDIGFTQFPVEREIGAENLMHQKIFRVGERVILGGMNANSKSGENVDAAVLVEGPGARRLVGIFARDTRLSLGARLKDVYDPEQTALLAAGGMYVGPSALISMLMNAAGKKVRGVDAPRLPLTPETLESLATKSDTRLDLLVDFEDVNGDGVKDGHDLEQFLHKGDAPSNVLLLKREGGRLLSRQVKEVAERVADARNQWRAADISLPRGDVQGKDSLMVGDSSVERTAIILHAIATAEEFVYIPTFVMTRPVARALAARYNELKAQGKTLDVRVAMDPGIYPDGGTPNEAGYLALEDAGVPVRWAMLPRTDATHHRKIHAKEIITEKMALLGSTNMSTRGMRSNWELSGLVEFDKSDAASLAQREVLTKDFLKTWDLESVRIDTKAVAENRLADKVGITDHATRVEEARHGVIMESIHLLSNYGRESAGVIEQLVASHPEVKEEIARRVAAGMTAGYATLSALDEKLGDTLTHSLQSTASWQSLHQLSSGQYVAVPEKLAPLMLDAEDK